MRAIFLILILAVVALIALIQSGLLSISQTRDAEMPAVAATGDGVTAKGGQTPAFQVETGSVAVGVKERNVQVAVPTVRVDAPRDQPPPTANSVN